MTNLTTAKQTLTTLELVKEIPLACLSFTYFHTMKFVFGNLYKLNLQRNNQKNEWQPLSTETLKSPFTLPFWMTFGPRLNTHAIIAPVGPLKVNHSVDIDIESANNSAKSWTIAIYQFPSYKTITKITSCDRTSPAYANRKICSQTATPVQQGEMANPDRDRYSPLHQKGGEPNNLNNEEKQRKLKLSPGNYMIGLRYYDWSENIELPSVKVDGSEIVKAKIISGDHNKFYSDLRTKRNWFYFWLNYYVFTVLSLKDLLPQSFVRKQFLPVGDSSLIYYYGIFRKKESLKFTINPLLLDNYNLYLTFYDRASFVLEFYQIDKQNHQTLSSQNDGFYLIRIRQKPELKNKFVEEWLKIEII